MMKRIEIDTIIKLHEVVTLPTLLYKAETWPLNTTDKKEIDKIEVWAWKNMLGLPKTTPTAAIVFTTGSLYASICVQIKQLIYLHKVLQKQNRHWTKLSLFTLREHNIGWAKQIDETMVQWGLDSNWDIIKEKSKNQWNIGILLFAFQKLTGSAEPLEPSLTTAL